MNCNTKRKTQNVYVRVYTNSNSVHCRPRRPPKLQWGGGFPVGYLENRPWTKVNYQGVLSTDRLWSRSVKVWLLRCICKWVSFFGKAHFRRTWTASVANFLYFNLKKKIQIWFILYQEIIMGKSCLKQLQFYTILFSVIEKKTIVLIISFW